LAFPWPVDRETAMDMAGQLLRLSGRDRVDGPQRIAQGIEALQWLNQLAENDLQYDFYDIFALLPELQAALQAPELAAVAAEVLGKLGTPRAQTALLELVLQDGFPLTLRQAAAEALAEAIRRRRVQLSPRQIAAQYQRYQQSEGLDEDTRRLLGFVLGKIDATMAETTTTVSD
jgi:HEAT repeat protein